MYLFHNYKETITLLDSEGRSYRIPANTPWEVPAVNGTDCNGTQACAPFTIPVQKVAKFLCDEGVHYGLVVVPEIRTNQGIQFDIAGAQALSLHKRKGSEDHILERYVKGAKEDELNKIPVRPPSASIASILESRGFDLKRDFGITPVGYRVSENVAARDAEVESLRRENAEMRRDNAEIKEMLARLLEQNTSPEEVESGGKRRR